MGYINFSQRNYLGKVSNYSVPAVSTNLEFDINPNFTSDEIKELFSGVTPPTFEQIWQGLKGITIGPVAYEYELAIGGTAKVHPLYLGSVPLTNDNTPGINFTLEQQFSVSGIKGQLPNNPEYILNVQLSSVTAVPREQAVWIERDIVGSDRPYLTAGLATPVYPIIVTRLTNTGSFRQLALVMVDPSGFAPAYSTISNFDYTSYAKFQEPPTSPYSPESPSGPAGGGGNFGNDRESEDLTPLIPNGSTENDLVDTGIFTRYLVNNAQLKEFAKWLFVDNWGEAILRELIISTFGNIYDSLISVMSYPFAVGQLPGITTSSGNIYLGSLNTGAPSSGILAKSFSQIDWGSITITEYWGNFLDYAPHTKIQLFLPWGTGFVDIDPNEVMNGTLQVKTNIELSKGTCVHIVYTGEGAIIGTYNGFCGAQYPITAVDTSGKAIGAAIAGVSLAVAGASGAIAKEAGERGLHALQVASSTKNAGYPDLPHLRMAGLNELHREATYNAMSAGAAKVAATSSLAAARIPATFNRNGSFAPNAAGMMPQKPFIVMTWPDQSVPEQYGSHVGYPSNIYISLGRLRGYTEVGAIHLEGINCTEHEREELMSLLQGGVIL